MGVGTYRRRVFPLALAAMLLLCMAAAAAMPATGRAASAPNTISNISFGPRTPNILRLNEKVTISFDYTTNEAAGVQIFARPMSGASLTPGYAAHGSPDYPVGAGTGTGYFTITAGSPTVTAVRFQMWNVGQTTLLCETIVPVHYQFKSATRTVTQLGLTATPNVLKFGHRVKVAFKYRAYVAGGVRIFVRPLTSGSMTHNYAAHASPLYPAGTGSGSGWFTITKGTTTVNQVRIQMWNANRTKKLYEAIVPVHYRYASTANIVYSLALSPRTPNVLTFDSKVTIAFKYSTNVAGGAMIFARPMTGASLTPNYAAHPSPVYPVGSGSSSGYFTITSGPVTVDGIRLQMWNSTQTKLLFQKRIPVSYQYE